MWDPTLHIYHPPILKKHVEEIVQRYAFPAKMKQQRLREQEKLKQQQEQSEEKQNQQQGEETAQGRSREQAAGESAGEEPEFPAVATASGDGNRPDREGTTPPTATSSDDAMVEDVVGAEDGVSMSEAPSAKEVERLDNIGAETGSGVVGSSKALGNMGQEGTELNQKQVEGSGGKQEKEQGQGHDEQGEEGDEGLPVLLLRELASFRARFSHRVGKHLRADASENLLKCQVSVIMCVFLAWNDMIG